MRAKSKFESVNLFNADFKRRNCPSARCATAANAIEGDTDISSGRSVSVNTVG